ncbi:MAG TPA: hypothetical protein VFA87_05195 [Rhizomicrobium sp.]|nr:hypothetical protein [Rhizomicrobium sp.]
MSVLMLGAATIAVPAMAQSADNNANAAESAQAAAPSNDNAAQAAGAANQSSNAAADASTSPSAQPNTQTAMNTTSNAAANMDVSSVGDTSKKYHRATRAKDFRAEQKITQQLNQQASAAAKPTQTASNQ